MKNTIGRHIFQRKLLAPGAMTNVENELFHKHVMALCRALALCDTKEAAARKL